MYILDDRVERVLNVGLWIYEGLYRPIFELTSPSLGFSNWTRINLRWCENIFGMSSDRERKARWLQLKIATDVGIPHASFIYELLTFVRSTSTRSKRKRKCGTYTHSISSSGCGTGEAPRQRRWPFLLFVSFDTKTKKVNEKETVSEE